MPLQPHSECGFTRLGVTVVVVFVVVVVDDPSWFGVVAGPAYPLIVRPLTRVGVEQFNRSCVDLFRGCSYVRGVVADPSRTSSVFYFVPSCLSRRSALQPSLRWRLELMQPIPVLAAPVSGRAWGGGEPRRDARARRAGCGGPEGEAGRGAAAGAPPPAVHRDDSNHGPEEGSTRKSGRGVPVSSTGV